MALPRLVPGYCREMYSAAGVEVSEGDFLHALDGWQVFSIFAGGHPIGGFAIKDGEGHIAILPEHRRKWATKAIFAQMKTLWSGPRKTAVRPGNREAKRLLRHFGMEWSGEVVDGREIYRSKKHE